MINDCISNVLKPTNVPVRPVKYSGKETTYITYFFYNEKGELWADDTEIETGYYLQVDVWSKNDFTPIVDQVKKLMNEAGFLRTSAVDLYEETTSVWHKAIRFYYCEEN